MFALQHWISGVFLFKDNRYKLNRSCRAMIYQWPVEVFHKVNLLDSWFVLSKAFTRLDNTTCTSITPFFIKSLSIHYCKLSLQLVLFLISSLHVPVHVFFVGKENVGGGGRLSKLILCIFSNKWRQLQKH